MHLPNIIKIDASFITKIKRVPIFLKHSVDISLQLTTHLSTPKEWKAE